MLESEFICGTLEGFYGRPWRMDQRYQLFQWMEEWDGMNTYMYAPKDDLYHRSKWRELYPETELSDLENLTQACQQKNLGFICAISPGLDITYSSDSDWDTLKHKANQIQEIGCTQFAILFDDIPSELTANDQKEFSSIANAQAQVANKFFEYLANADCSLIFCPTVYCGNMADNDIANNVYLNELGNSLIKEIGFFWTGPEVVSIEIPVDSIQELRQVIKRKPIIWDNLHANDYDIKQIFFGPYSGRALELKKEVSGILSNPNCQFWANFNPLRTLAMYSIESESWNSYQAYLESSKEWIQYFGNVEITENEILLLGDCFYTTGRLGNMGHRLVESVQYIMSNDPVLWDAHLDTFKKLKTSLNSLSLKLTKTTNRDLLYDYYSLLWELQEKIDYVNNWISCKQSGENELKSLELVPRKQGIINELQKVVHSNELNHPTM